MARQPMAIEDDIAAHTRITEEPAAPLASTQTKPVGGPSFQAPARLEPFLLLAKSARGAGAAKLVQEATAAPEVFVFGELLDMSSIKELASQEQFAPQYRLLELFAYGTWRDYADHSSAFPPFKEAHIQKLKQLSLVSFASTSRNLPYSFLMEKLDVASVRELEDLVIEAIYMQLLSGRLDQRNSRLAIDSVKGRDVRALKPCYDALMAWAQQIDTAISMLDDKIKEARQVDARNEKSRATQTSNINRTLQEISLANTSNKSSNNRMDAASADFYGERSPSKANRQSAKESATIGGMDVDDYDDDRKTGRQNRKRNRAT